MQYRKKAISDKILNAAMEEFTEKGYKNSNIVDIAKKAGAAVGNVYRYFEGKSGLLDALVKETYVALPKLIDELAWIDQQDDFEIEELMSTLSSMLINLFEQHGAEFILLVDKCDGTKYEDFAEKIIRQVSHLVHIKFYGKDSPSIDRIMARLASKAFVHSIFDILRINLESDALEETIRRLMNFYFYALDIRK